MTAYQKYCDLLVAPSDIREHLPALYRLAAGRRVVEFGTRRATSTAALLAGGPRTLTTYDLVRTDELTALEVLADSEDAYLRFVQTDIDALESIPECDFVFIDAMHNGNSVAIQLQLARRAGATCIALHDTEIFGRSGDLTGTPGILDAVDAFIAAHPEWRITDHTNECFGFTILNKNL